MLTTDWALTWPSPTAAYSADRSLKCISVAMASSASPVAIRCSGRPCLRMARAIAPLPVSAAASRRSLENQCLILFRARALLTKPSQSLLGPASGALEVKISTVSPLSRALSSATRRPLTLAPMHRWPTSVWIA